MRPWPADAYLNTQSINSFQRVKGQYEWQHVL